MKARPSVIDLMEDPAWFASSFEGPSWDGWKSLLKGIYQLPMTETELAFFLAHTGRTVPLSAPVREVCFTVGRRGGKSICLALMAVHAALAQDFSRIVAKGELAVFCIASATKNQARQILSYVRGLLESVPALAREITLDDGENIELKRLRVRFWVGAASPRSLRGFSVAFAALDEAAFMMTSDGSVNLDIEVLRAVRPALANIPGSRLVVASSPYARRGILWELHRTGFGHDDAPHVAIQAATIDLNPLIDPEFIRAEFERDPVSAEAELNATFRTDVEALVGLEAVTAVVVPGRYELPFRSGLTYRAFVDPAAGGADAFTVAISHSEDGKAVLDLVRGSRPVNGLFSPEAVVNEFSEILKGYRISRVVGDRFAGEYPRELFRKNGIQYETSERTKSEIYHEFLAQVLSGKCELLDHPKVIKELLGLERRTSRAGKDSIDHGPGGGQHDDYINAAAGSLLLAQARRPMRISRALLSRI